MGETLLYSKEGHTVCVKIESLNLGSGGVLRYVVKLSDGVSFETTKESLRSPDSPDIGWITTPIPEKKSSVADLPDETIKSIANPAKVSPLQEEFLALHERLWHLPFSVWFRLVKAGCVPKKFHKLNNKASPCVSCMLGHAHRKPWRFKKTKHGTPLTLKPETISQPGDTIGVDQLISAQPGLVLTPGQRFSR